MPATDGNGAAYGESDVTVICGKYPTKTKKRCMKCPKNTQNPLLTPLLTPLFDATFPNLTENFNVGTTKTYSSSIEHATLQRKTLICPQIPFTNQSHFCHTLINTYTGRADPRRHGKFTLQLLHFLSHFANINTDYVFSLLLCYPTIQPRRWQKNMQTKLTLKKQLMGWSKCDYVYYTRIISISYQFKIKVNVRD